MLIGATYQRCIQYGPQKANFRAILDPNVSQNSGLWSLSQKVFTDFTSLLLHILIASTFSGVWNIGLGRLICGPFWALKTSKLRNLDIFLKQFALVSFQCFCSLQELLRCVQFCGHFRPEISKHSGPWSFPQQFSIGSVTVLVYKSIWATFRGLLNIGLRGPISGSFLALK